MEMKKILALSVILLFIGVAVAPSINFTVVKASQDDDLVEVTTQACGINGFGNTTVKLTREQYQNLEQYLVEFRARLNQTTTREETVQIFKEAVVELNKYGLLPRGMSVERAFRLLMNQNNQRIFNVLDLDPEANYFCLISGLTTVTFSLGPLNVLTQRSLYYLLRHQDIAESLENLYDNLYNWLESSNHLILLGLLVFGNIILSLNFLLGGVLTTFLPFGLFSLLTFGRIIYEIDGGEKKYPSSGWVSSIGLNGLKKYEGSTLWGEATNESVNIMLFSQNYPGVIGFTGLKLTLMTDNFDKTFFLGSALKVKLRTE
jgi:hypothetical protein